MPVSCPVRDKCDEPLTYPPVSTGQIARSGKPGLPDVARTPIQAHFQPVFGTRGNRNGRPQGSDTPEVFIPRMAVASVHAPIWRRHAGGFGQRQVGSIQGSERRGGTGQVREPGRAEVQRKRRKPPAAVLVNGKGTTASAKRRRGAKDRKAQAGRTDATASRSESRMPARAPVTNLWRGRPQGKAARG